MKNRFAALPLIAAVLAGHTVEAQPGSAALRAKAMAYVSVHERASNLPVARSAVKIELVDLGGDPTPEALLIIEQDCGARGCSAFVLDLTGPRARVIGEFIAADIRALDSRTHGWRDISLNGTRQVYRNGRYGRR